MDYSSISNDGERQMTYKQNKSFQALVQVDRDYVQSLLQSDDFNMLSCTIFSIDPITNNRCIIVFSDDGNGNGTPIPTIQL